MYANSAIGKYRQTHSQSSVAEADPHRLIQMLLAGALERLATAKGHIQRKEFLKKGQVIGRAIQIIGALQSSLNMDEGGEIAFNLFRLYDYMLRKLAEANAENSAEKVEEVINLIKEIKEGWDGIRSEFEQNNGTAVAPEQHIATSLGV